MRRSSFQAALFLVFRGFLAGSAPVLAAEGAGGAAAPGSRMQMAMTIFAGGIQLGKLDMDATMTAGDYHIVSNLET